MECVNGWWFGNRLWRLCSDLMCLFYDLQIFPCWRKHEACQPAISLRAPFSVSPAGLDWLSLSPDICEALPAAASTEKTTTAPFLMKHLLHCHTSKTSDNCPPTPHPHNWRKLQTNLSNLSIGVKHMFWVLVVYYRLCLNINLPSSCSSVFSWLLFSIWAKTTVAGSTWEKKMK